MSVHNIFLFPHNYHVSPTISYPVDQICCVNCSYLRIMTGSFRQIAVENVKRRIRDRQTQKWKFNMTYL